MKTAAQTTEQWPLARFVPYARNPRKNDHAVERMAASIREFGFKIPVLARSDGTVVDGHLRLKAAAQLNLKTLPVILCDEWTEAQVKAFRLMVNRSVTWAEWDDELLALELAELKELDYNLDLTGFEEAELSELLAEKTVGLTDEDEVPEAPAEPVTQPGDLWILGKHRLLCGDSTKAEDVERLMGGQKAHLCLTDPPYGIDEAYDGYSDSVDNLKVLIDNFLPLANAWFLKRGSLSAGDHILDPFTGSGSTVIACEEGSRHCHGLELSAIYCDVIVIRWQNFTGQQATLDGTKQTFAEISQTRKAAA